MERFPIEVLEDAINLEKAVIEACEKSEVDTPANDRVVLEFLQELKEYRCTGLTPEKIIEVDKAFYDRCQEINRLNAELAELKKQPQGDLISRDALIADIRNTITEQSGIIDWLNLINKQPIAYNVEKIVEQLTEAMERYEDVAFYEMNTNGHTLDFEYSNGKKDGVGESIDIIRKGGKE